MPPVSAAVAHRSIAEMLIQDHREIDALFGRAAKGDSAAYAAFQARLRVHMQLEEELLFPALADQLLGPVSVMKQEHDLIRELLTKSDFEAIAACLTNHNLKEERILYPACEGPTFAALEPKVNSALASAR